MLQNLPILQLLKALSTVNTNAAEEKTPACTQTPTASTSTPAASAQTPTSSTPTPTVSAQTPTSSTPTPAVSAQISTDTAEKTQSFQANSAAIPPNHAQNKAEKSAQAYQNFLSRHEQAVQRVKERKTP